jgi:3-phosphoshikimate 1-carboxyvinyltransferase
MQVKIEPSVLDGSLRVPASKSMMQRACAAALLHNGKTTIYNPGTSDDDNAALKIIRLLGADVMMSDDKIEITSSGIYPKTDFIDCGESGLSARMFLPIIAISNKQIAVTGSGTLLNRPMHIFGELLPQLGANVKSNNGYLPFSIKGPLKPRSVTLDGSTSSQFLTGLLFAFSRRASERVIIQVNDLKSRPYIDMTLEMLELFGKPVSHENYERFIIDPSRFKEKSDIQLSIEADWSSAAFWLVAGAIAGDITLQGLNIRSTQADRAILNVLKKAGVDVHAEAESIGVRKTMNLQAFFYDATDTPDLFPILAILASYCKGESRITGTHRLRHKESNRLESICDMLQKFGVGFSTIDDELCIAGGNPLQGCEINSYHDHRIVMAASVAALGAGGAVTINGAEAVSKSYPDFFSDLSLLGGKLSINTHN